MFNTRVVISVLAACFLSSMAFAAGKKEGVILSNKIDDALTIHSVALLPAVDNVDGIFAKPIDKRLKELLEQDHQWSLTNSNFAGGLLSAGDIIKNPQKAVKLAAPLKVDGLVLAEVRKNPKDFTLALHMFSGKDGSLVTQVAATDLDQSSIDKALVQLDELYKQLKYRLPYDGLVLSRTKNRVTMNLGQVDGVKQGQELTASKIIAFTRHPKLGYIIQHEKVLIGKIKLVKVDSRLSFGDIVSETENGAIQKDSKITGARMLIYSPEQWIGKDYLPPELLLSEDNQVNGKIQEWRPELPPTFGHVGARLEFGKYQENLTLANGKTLSAKNPIYPSIHLFGEMWINPEWYVNAGLTQGTGTMTNPRGGPDLSANLGEYSLDLGYNLLLKDDFFDSKLFFALGFYKFKMSMDYTNDGLTTSEYSSTRLTIGGKTPIDMNNQWYLGATLFWYLHPSFHESPVSSGNDDNSMVHFNFLLDYRYSERIWFNSGLEFKTFQTDFTGTGTRPTPGVKGSHKTQMLLFGVSYMF
jgi:hypothetical protein